MLTAELTGPADAGPVLYFRTQRRIPVSRICIVKSLPIRLDQQASAASRRAAGRNAEIIEQ